MKRKNFMLSVAAAAVLGAFNPAVAQQENPSAYNANVGISNTDVNASANISPGVNLGSGDQSVSSSTNASQSSTDINSSSTMNQSASTAQSSGDTSGSGSATAQTDSAGAGATSQGSASSDASISSSDSFERERHGKARGHDDDKLTGLDRADQVAGEHGAHGRANAREKQGLN